MNSECSSILEWIKKQKEKFANIEYAYDQLCLEHDNIEMVKTGVLKIDPYKHTYVGEKELIFH